MSDKKPAPLTYAASGVDIEAADRAKERVKRLARSTFNPSVVGDIGSFGGLFRADFGGLGKPLLVASADGVGTKLKIAFLTGVHNTVGIDLVAHCTNDILVQGATPLFFLDYVAAGRLDPEVVERVVEGLAEGCRQSGCVLLGGETAEMPDFYGPGEYDLAGFIVGVVDEGRVLGADRVRRGDVLLGLASSGLHTNGYSLARKLFFDTAGLKVSSFVTELERTVGEELLIPHRNYLPIMKEFLSSEQLHAMAHVTGGGIPGNLNRVLPGDCDGRIRLDAWRPPPVFRFIQERGGVRLEEMFRAFNMGIGLILVVSPESVQGWIDRLDRHSAECFQIGEIVAGSGRVWLE